MKIANDQATFDACPTIDASWVSGRFRCFALKDRTDIIRAEVFKTDVLLTPERSSGHKAVISALGLNEAPAE